MCLRATSLGRFFLVLFCNGVIAVLFICLSKALRALAASPDSDWRKMILEEDGFNWDGLDEAKSVRDETILRECEAKWKDPDSSTEDETDSGEGSSNSKQSPPGDTSIGDFLLDSFEDFL